MNENTQQLNWWKIKIETLKKLLKTNIEDTYSLTERIRFCIRTA